MAWVVTMEFFREKKVVLNFAINLEFLYKDVYLNEN